MRRPRKPSPKRNDLANLTERAYRELEEMIATLALAPGTVVSEAALSKQLGIGRTPVREAMKRLARERLLQILPRRGCIVADSRPDEELNVIEARRPIEILVVRTAAIRANAEERQAFERIANAMASSLASEDFNGFARLDAEFNDLCLAACRNPIAASMMQLITTLNRRYWFMHHGRTLPAEGVEHHVEIARAIARGDAEAAAGAAGRLLDYIESWPRKVLAPVRFSQ
ncbi:GntR family transcriptional regulator [Bradyrhizobium sp. AUGA SZCCT0222]|uniref:GntR family transcriptional regulator n=1 Tax=Bradyrhizobium sp. AUGA SZCCT0222 TaxID=2807668 RepID=UPI001BAD9BC4|nr:GntR family transcriptional regulator [Bradyrhizobium sp. AUGA SZCCT0222]MBR1266771.1 GntR family transcriptional regulator [Bradyrhizobium sp. AUGA SZCCT0222]